MLQTRPIVTVNQDHLRTASLGLGGTEGDEEAHQRRKFSALITGTIGYHWLGIGPDSPKML